MAAPLIGKYDTPDLMDRTAGLDWHAGLDATATLRAVQGIINTYLAHNTTDGRREIPTPVPSPPVPELMEDGKREAVGLNGGEAARGDAAVVEKGAIWGSMLAGRGENGPLLGINVPEATGDTPQVSEAAHSMATDGKDRVERTTEVVGASSTAGKMDCDGPPTGSGNNAGDSSKPPSPPAMNVADQACLQHLAEEITRNVSQLATDDASRIKAATAALELAAAVRPPPDTIMGWFANMSVISAVRLFMHWGAFDIIPAGKGESLTVTELAAQLNAEEVLITRVASMLTSSHILTHSPPPPSSPHPFAPPSPSLSHTPTSLHLRSNQPMSAMFALMYTNIAHVSTILPSYFDTYGRREPLGPAYIPTSYLAGHPAEDFFSLLRKDETALRNFGRAMRMTSRRVPVTGMYDMEWVLTAAADGKREVVWVDVGGGDGHTVGQFLRVYGPGGLRAGQCVVQDLEEVVRAAEREVKQEEGDAVLRGVKWVGLDFMREAPMEGALVYYLRHILRDYSDPVCITILTNVARAMTDPDARVLISEQLNPDVSAMAGPLPLYAAFKDFSMLSIGGKERSLKEFAAIADAAGLRVSGVFRDGATPHAVLELALKG